MIDKITNDNGRVKTSIRFDKKYFGLAVLLFLIEVLIAVWVHDRIVRPYIGDLLVVILLYCMLKSFWNIVFWKAAMFVFVFSFVIETLQYFHLVRKLGLQHSKLANIVIGNTFQWIDLVMYTLGILIVLLIEIKINKPNQLGKSIQKTRRDF